MRFKSRKCSKSFGFHEGFYNETIVHLLSLDGTGGKRLRLCCTALHGAWHHGQYDKGFCELAKLGNYTLEIENHRLDDIKPEFSTFLFSLLDLSRFGYFGPLQGCGL